MPEAIQEPLGFQTHGAVVNFTVPEVRFWNVIVIEYHAKEGLS